MKVRRWLKGWALALGMLTICGLPVRAQESGEAPAAKAKASVTEGKEAKPEGKKARTETGEKEDEASKPARFLFPSGGQLTVGENGFGLGSQMADPTALRGINRTPIVLAGSDRNATLNLTGHYLHWNGDRQRFLAEVNLDPYYLGTDLGYSIQPKGWDGVLSANFAISSGQAAPFQGGDRHIDIRPGDDKAWLYQLTGGLEYTQTFTEDLDFATSLHYLRVQVADQQFGGNLVPYDTLGGALTGSPTATDEYLFLSTNGIFSTLNDRDFPTRGTKIRFGLEHGAGLGAGNSGITRFSTNISHLIGMPGPSGGKSSLLLNLQTGFTAGQVPAWAGFNLGGVNSVRGYFSGELGTAKSFLQATAEYRAHLTDFEAFGTKQEMRGVVFADWATDFDTSSEVLGQPGPRRLKKGQGAGYGFGLQFAGDAGLLRLETGWNDRGRNSVWLTVGDRF